MDTEHTENEGMRRLLGDVLDDAEFDADVVPAVLSGYERTVRIRRYGATGTALAVLAVAAGTALLLPRSGSGAAGPGRNGPSTTKPSVAVAKPGPGSRQSALATDPARCGHQHWNQMYSDGVQHPPGYGQLSSNPAAEQANCGALAAAVAALFPDVTLMPEYTSNLELDSRVDQKALKQLRDAGSPSALMAQTGAEEQYLSIHPEDPANVDLPGSYSLVTSSGRENFSIAYSENPSVLGTVPDCDTKPASLPGLRSRCTLFPATGGWRGAVTSFSNVTGTDDHSAALTDDHGHYVTVTYSGVDPFSWYQNNGYSADGGVNDPNRGKWTNRWTGQVFAGAFPPATPVLSEAQWLSLLSSPGFGTYLSGYVRYWAGLPADPTPTR